MAFILKSPPSDVQKESPSAIKEVLQRGATGISEGFLGTHGSLLDLLGLQPKESLLPGQRAILEQEAQVTPEELIGLSSDDDLIGISPRLASTADVRELSGMLGFPTGKPETVAGRIAERTGRGAGAAVAFGGEGVVPLAVGGALGQATEEATGSELAGTLVELGTGLRVDKLLSKALQPGAKVKDIVEAGERWGLTPKEITPLMQSEGKLAWFSKIARKGSRQEKILEAIENKLGTAYDTIKSTAGEPGNSLSGEAVSTLANDFTEIINDLGKTLKAPADKQQAIDFMIGAKDALLSEGANAESLINFFQDANHITNWGKAGRKVLAQIKKPIMKALRDVNPEAAEDFSMLNKLWGSFKTAEKHLTPGLVDKFAAMGEFGSIIISMATGHPGFVKRIIGEVATRQVATEILMNPRFQNMSRKLLKAMTDNKMQTVASLSNQITDFVKEEGEKVESPKQKGRFKLVKNQK